MQALLQQLRWLLFSIALAWQSAWLLVPPLPRGAIHHLPLFFCLDFIWCWRHSPPTVLAATLPAGCGADTISGELPEFQDGMHGLVVWGIATLLAGLIAAITLPLLPRTPGVAATTPNATSSVPGESLIAFELDRLFRGSERRTGGDLSYDRAEAARILLTTSSHSGMDPTDRAYLGRLIAADTGMPVPDAERRVDEVAARVKQDISRARSSAVILAFMAGVAALLGAIAAWTAAIAAGRYRDGREPIPYLLDWSIESRSRGTQQSIPKVKPLAK